MEQLTNNSHIVKCKSCGADFHRPSRGAHNFCYPCRSDRRKRLGRERARRAYESKGLTLEQKQFKEARRLARDPNFRRFREVELGWRYEEISHRLSPPEHSDFDSGDNPVNVVTSSRLRNPIFKVVLNGKYVVENMLDPLPTW